MERYNTIKCVVDGRMTNGEAAAALGLSVRQIRRLKRRVEAQGPQGVVHASTGRQPPNTKPQALRDKVVRLAKSHYAKFNFSHVADMLAAEHNVIVSDETVRRWLRALGLGRPQRRVKAHRRRRERKAREGELLFLDGSPHHWFGDDRPECCLLLCSDDATGKPLYGKFQQAEDRDGCFEVCNHVIRKHGRPVAFYLDKASQFTTTRHGGSHVKQGPQADPTHFETAMRALSIGLIFADSPQARGRGERLNGSFQDRLVAELTYKGITDYEQATRYLNSTFIPNYTRRFGKPPADPVAAWRPLPQGTDLKAVLCAREQRTVANDNTVSFNGTIYQLDPPDGYSHIVKAKLEVQQHFDGSVHFCHPQHGRIKARVIQPNTKSPRAHSQTAQHDGIAQQPQAG